MAKMERAEVGDGNLPNRYWVSIADDYYICATDSDGAMCCDWKSEQLKTPVRAKTPRCCPTFAMALGFARSLPFGDEYKGVRILSIVIDDRISGMVWEKTRHFFSETGTVHDEENDDTKFTRETMRKRGVRFV